MLNQIDAALKGRSYIVATLNQVQEEVTVDLLIDANTGVLCSLVTVLINRIQISGP